MDLLKIYLDQIGRIRRLTPAEEVQCGKQVQQLQSFLKVRVRLTQQQKRSPTNAEWCAALNLPLPDLLKAVMSGEVAKRRMVEANLRLVVAIAKKYTYRNVNLLDLIQEGNVGLQRGVERFDSAKGYRLSTYVYWWIWQAVTRAVAEKSRTIRLPLHVTEKLNRIKKAQRQIAQRVGRTATVTDIAKQVNLSAEQVRSYSAAARRLQSLNQCIDDHELELGNLIEDQQPLPEEIVTYRCLQEDLTKLLEILPLRQQRILSLRFGLKTGKPLSPSQVSRQLVCSRETVRLLEKEAIRTLKTHGLTLKAYLK